MCKYMRFLRNLEMLRKIKTPIIPIVFVLLLILVIVFERSKTNSSQHLNNEIQKIIDKDRTKYDIPGIEVSISLPGEKLPRDFVSGTITANSPILVKPDNLFQIGSETKTFISTIILQLEAENLLSINDPISKWLPHLPSAWQNITIKQLLNHTSGIFEITETEEFWKIERASGLKKQWTPEELINLVAKKTSYFKPGIGWHYSNTNYYLAGMIIHAVTGKSVEEEMKIRLLEPLKLSNTYYLPRAYSQAILQRMAHGYSDRFSETAQDVTDINMSMADASGATISTSHDTAILFRKLLATNSILQAKQQNELMSLVDKDGKAISPESKKSGYGLGIGRHIESSGDEIWFHGGGTLGYLANMLWVKGNDVVITTAINHGSKKAEAGSNALRDDLIAYLKKSIVSSKCNYIPSNLGA